MKEMEEPNILDRERNIAMERNESLEDSDNVVGEIEDPSNLGRVRDEDIQNPHSLVGERERGNSSSSMVVRERKSGMDSPPVDDCCPICFDNFIVPCKTNCGHWFCGRCILDYWRYSAAALQRCKCPICSKFITKLTPEASLALRQEEKVIQVLKNVHNYNRLFVGGVRGLILKVLQLPLLIKRFFQGLMDPDRVGFNYRLMQYIALFLSVLYKMSNRDFIPIGRSWINTLFDIIGFALVLILFLVGLYRRRRLRDRARLLAAP